MAEGSGQGSQWGDFWKVGGVSFTVAILIGAGAAGGVALDRKLGTKPVFSLLLLVAGLVAGGWYAYRALTEMLK
jgi:hypothetical protein